MALWLAAAGRASGRVGETQPELEAHLLGNASAKKLGEPLTVLQKYQTGGGGQGQGYGGRGGGGGGSGLIYVMEGFDFQLIDNLMHQAAGEEPAAPDARGVFPSTEFILHNYFKSDDGSSAEVDLQRSHYALAGWELLVYFYKGVSVLEIYRRIHKPLEDGEITLILTANQGKSKWENASVPAATWEQKGDSFLGYDYARDDGMVRALKKGNDLVLFSAGMDKELVGLMDKAKAVSASTTKSGASTTSVRGF